MFDGLDIFRLARGMAEHASVRQDVVSRNLAHADTPGYQQQDVASFADIVNATDALNREGEVLPEYGSSGFRSQTVRSASTSPNGNSVSLETEIMKSAEIRQQHDMALSIYKSAMTVLRTTLGRR